MTDQLESSISSVVDRRLASLPTVLGVSVAVEPPGGDVVTVARGLADRAEGVAMTADHAVRVASCTKTFVASTVIELASRGLLALDQPAVEIAPVDDASVLAEHEFGGHCCVDRSEGAVG
jgi:D-alanyl-D-alanine carboxypeptidase